MDVYLRRTVILKLPFARRPLDGFGALYKTVSRPRKGRSMTGIIRWCSYNTRTIKRIVEVWRFPCVQMTSCVSCLDSTKGILSCDFLFIWKSYENHANIMRKGNTCISCDYHVIFVIIINYNTFHTFQNFTCFRFSCLPDQNTIRLSVTFLNFFPEISPGTGMPRNCCRTTLEEPKW